MRIFRIGLKSFVAPVAFISGKGLRSRGMWRSMAAVIVALLLSGAVSSATVYKPSSYNDTGTTTISPQNAYDGSLTTYATVYGDNDGVDIYTGHCEFYNFPSVVISTAKTLTVTVAVDITATGTVHNGQIKYSLDQGSTFQPLLSTSTSITQTNVTVSVPSGTNLSNVRVLVLANPGTGSGNWVNVYIYDINIQ